MDFTVPTNKKTRQKVFRFIFQVIKSKMGLIITSLCSPRLVLYVYMLTQGRRGSGKLANKELSRTVAEI